MLLFMIKGFPRSCIQGQDNLVLLNETVHAYPVWPLSLVNPSYNCFHTLFLRKHAYAELYIANHVWAIHFAQHTINSLLFSSVLF